MAQKFHADTAAALRSPEPQLFTFIDINVSPPIYLTDYHGDTRIARRRYIASLLKAVTPPPRTGTVTQEVQKIAVVEALNGFTAMDFMSTLGGAYHGAPVIVRTLVVGLNGELLTYESQVVTRSEGLLKGAVRDVQNSQVILEITNSYGQLDMIKELRTTRGSLARWAPNDTSFDQADAVDDNIVLEWGS